MVEIVSDRLRRAGGAAGGGGSGSGARGEAAELDALGPVEAIDGLDEPEDSMADQVIEIETGRRVDDVHLADDEADEWQVLFDNAFPFGRGEWAGQFVHVVLRAPCPVKGVTAQ